MKKPNGNTPSWQFPADLPGLLSMLAMATLPLIVAGYLLTPLFGAISGDPIGLWMATVLAGVGIVLLFYARLPFYRQRRFFTLGPGPLDAQHRRIYRWAYLFIGASVPLLVLGVINGG